MSVAHHHLQDEPRFAFGKNWQNFSLLVNEERVQVAQKALQTYLHQQDLTGLRFLDLGCGSGLMSLAARRLGAEVLSVDIDPDCISCTKALKEVHLGQDTNWRIQRGSVLNAGYVRSLGSFDVVYSWGVLHHTGAMWEALDNCASLVGPNGRLFISVYNHQRVWSSFWLHMKKLYNRLPKLSRWVLVGLMGFFLVARTALADIVRHGDPSYTWRTYSRRRGMSRWHDVIDWIGGYPFEVAKPEEIFQFLYERGFTLTKLRTCGGSHGCNEFVFQNSQPSMSQA